jgi:hypothetical protein
MVGHGTEDDELFEPWEPDEEPTPFDETRMAYSGLTDIENPPLDEIELEEAGLLLDDPDAIALLPGGMDDPDGVTSPPVRRPAVDEVGWDLDEGTEPDD